MFIGYDELSGGKILVRVGNDKLPDVESIKSKQVEIQQEYPLDDIMRAFERTIEKNTEYKLFDQDFLRGTGSLLPRATIFWGKDGKKLNGEIRDIYNRFVNSENS